MSFLSIILIAISLSVDSFAVSVICGIKSANLKLWSLLKVPTMLAAFQAVFTVIGWVFGFFVKDIISIYDHWIAFLLLLLIGGKMIWESYNGKNKKIKSLSFLFLCGLGVATSIDAAAVGLSLALLDVNVYFVSIIVFIATFIFSVVGLKLGKNFGNKFSKAELIGGIILIAIGIKILAEHLL